MSIIDILQTLVLLATVAIGVLALIRPEATVGFTGLAPTSVRGTSEIRAILGGLFVGLGIAPLVLGTVEAYQVIGIGYLAVAAARAFSIIYDRSYAGSNLISLGTEIVFGVILILK
jgi:uncharacterized membrane protein